MDEPQFENPWQRCEHCGFATATIAADDFRYHECNVRLAGDVRPLWPLYHACGALVLYSTVPVRQHDRVPPPEKLLLMDGRTPMWTPTRAMLLGRTRPKAPDCHQCGESVNRSLRTRPVLN